MTTYIFKDYPIIKPWVVWDWPTTPNTTPYKTPTPSPTSHNINSKTNTPNTQNPNPNPWNHTS